MTDLPKTFEPGPIESRWYDHWETAGLFRPERPDAEPFTIVMPPPNVTGSLHIGHALDNTLQDILIRRARMQDKDSLWVVGTDHAGIATQMVVERQLDAEGQKRTDLGREAFLDRVWRWKAESGGQITRQLRRLGASCDWSNERFTMDPGFSKAVTHVFVELHKRGLLYRDKRLVNWDPRFGTAISDLEVETREVQGKFWHLRYPLADGSGQIEVATTRPETMLADMAVAVHPTDERYAALVGRQVRLPITGRLIPIIADEHADPELGSGAVKITPGHDFNDYEVGRRAGIKPGEMLNMLDGAAHVVQTADGLVPDELLGRERFDARRRVVELLEAEGALARQEDRTVATPFGDRSGVVIEPWLTDQWYVDAQKLAGPAIEAVRSGAIRIVPESWSKTWFNWLEGIQPWCVSRQLWWGHRIPAWYGPKILDDDRTDPFLVEDVAFVAASDAELQEQLTAYYGDSKTFVFVDSEEAYLERDEAISSNAHLQTSRTGEVAIYRDPDVLDTWFSSALWPFATLGWPDDQLPSLSRGGPGVGDDEAGSMPGSSLDGSAEESFGERTLAPAPGPSRKREGSDLSRHYPNDVLISGFDILFFWDARMAMQGLEFMGEVPWRTLYLHGLVRDAAGQKMSKSKGNTVDPLGLIDRFGADALRFTLAAMESQGRDIKLDEKRVEGYRNFATKLWNAARFLKGNGVGASTSVEAPPATLPVSRWIIGEVVETLAKLNRGFDELRFDGMADAIYHFTWGTFCDWYVELIKPELSAPESRRPEPVEGPSSLASREQDSPSTGSGQTEVAAETRAVAAWAFDQILVMLHPFMPFVTEELWHAMGKRPYDLIVAKWPEPKAQVDASARAEVGSLIEVIEAARAIRAELNIPWTATLTPHLIEADGEVLRRLAANAPTLARMAKLEPPVTAEAAPPSSAQVSAAGVTIAFPLGDAIDLDAERARLAKAVAAAEKERDGLAARLANPSFTERARPEAVEKARADHAARAAEAERLQAALARLG